ncbi:MAG: glycosyltransferase family 4 protein [Ilumatobacteraceae bacterium]|nr:glycosyltransferase family 1 protein [Actinomycetota bacterium]
MRHLLVTNDFPPKVGGIQSLLWEWWRRLPADDVSVFTSPHRDAAAFDAAAPFVIDRAREPVLLPHPGMSRRIRERARRHGADLVVLDPAVPVGLVGPRLGIDYDVVLHGAEVTVPGRLPVTRPMLASVLRGARHIIAAGGYPAAEAERAARCNLPITVIPPGVDVERFVPHSAEQRVATRRRYGIDPDAEVVVAVSRLVPRKGFDTAIRAVARLARRRSDLVLVIAGAGRDDARLRRLATEVAAPVRFLGRVPDAELPAVYAMADVATMLCRTRWGGLEQEGFGIVFLEAAAAGVPQLAGRSGGAAEAVDHDVTGLIVDRPSDVGDVAVALESLLNDRSRLAVMAEASRRRAVEQFSYDALSARLATVLGCG